MYDSWGDSRLARRGPWLALVLPGLILVLTAPLFGLHLLLRAEPAGLPQSADLVAATADVIYLDDEPYTPPWQQPAGPAAGWQPVVRPGIPPAPTTQACTGAVCYRLVPGLLGVERSADAGATWVVDWQIGDADRQVLADRRHRNADDLDREFVSVAVAVQPQTGGGHVVLVANKLDGYAVRDTAGVWTRIGFPDTGTAAPAIGSGRPVPRSLVVAVVALLGALVVLIGATRASARGWGRTTWRSPVILTIGALALLVPARAAGGTLAGVPIALLAAGVVVIECAVYAVLSTLRVLNDGPGQDRWSVQVWAGGLLTATAVGAVWLLRYAQRLPGGATTGIAVTVVAFAVGAWIAGTAARRIDDDVTPTPRAASKQPG